MPDTTTPTPAPQVTAADIIAMTNLALSLVEKLMPLFTSTGATPAEQQAVRDKYLALRNSGDAAFTGPEWEQG